MNAQNLALAVNAQHELMELESPHEVLTSTGVRVKTLRVGVCATDREIVETGAIFKLPKGEDFLVLGHEASGIVEEVGSDVTNLRPGDLVVPLISEHRNKGVDGHGFFRPEFIEEEDKLVKLDQDLREVASLVEPLTVTFESIRRANYFRSAYSGIPFHENPAAAKQRVLVVGCGPIGLLGALLCRTFDYEVSAVDIVDSGVKLDILNQGGVQYINALVTPVEKIKDTYGTFDIIVIAAPSPKLLVPYSKILSRGGVLALVGWNGGSSQDEVDLSTLIREMIHNDNAITASVGSKEQNFLPAARALEAMNFKLGVDLQQFISKVIPAEAALDHFFDHDRNNLVTVIEY